MSSDEEMKTCQTAASVECSWYENDLQLAAELGKNLLERNLELEEELQNAAQLQSDQSLEIDLLQKQLEILRNVNESRMRMYEDVDHNSHELEKLNERLMKEKKSDKECIQSLTETAMKLEERCEELQELQERSAKEEKERNRIREKKRIRSVPSLLQMNDDDDHYNNFQNGYDYLGYPSLFGGGSRGLTTKQRCLPVRDAAANEIQSLHQNVKRLEVQLGIEKNKRKLSETEIANVLDENKTLEEKLNDLVESRRIAVATNKVVMETAKEGKKRGNAVDDAYSSDVVVCSECGASRKLTVADKSEMIEHDLDALPKGQVVRLKNGGSAYGSRESLHLIGLETDDTTPSLEVCSAILASDITERIHHQQQQQQQANKPSFSLLGELEEQYRKLVVRYEALIEVKNLRSPTKLDMATQDNLDGSGGQARSSAGGGSSGGKRPKNLLLTDASSSSERHRRSLDLSSPLNTIEGHFENGPLEYKRLFKEIFETLRRSVVYEDDQNSSQIAK